METNGEQLRLSQSVLSVIKPIIYDMTRIDFLQRSQIIHDKNEPDWVRTAKRSCCHVILDSTGTPTLALTKTDDGKLICDACKRPISIKFDEENTINVLTAALDVINRNMVLGLIYGVDANAVATLTSVKSVFPDIIQLTREINERMQNKQTAEKISGSLASEYNSKFTGVYNNAFTSIRR